MMYNISSNRFGKEPLSLKQKHASKVLHILKKKYPNAKIALKYDTNFQLLVAVILSAQCTDKKVNEVTEPIFRKYKTAADFARIHQKKFETMIRPTGFYRAKAKNILETAKIIRDKFGGMVTKTMPEMLTHKGVARKTANVVLGNAYGVVEGIAVDTHVIRLSRRLGFSKNKDPEKIEKDLMKLFAKNIWFILTYLLIDHGRTICDAKKPSCDDCFLNKLCPSAFKFPHFRKN